MEEAYENIYTRADLGKYAAAEDVVKLRKMMELTIKGLMNERIWKMPFSRRCCMRKFWSICN